MDYLKIVLEGFINPTTSKHLTDYFIREFKKIESEHFSSMEFFESGCLRIVDVFISDIKTQLFEEKERLYEMINAANSGVIKYQELSLEQMKNPKLVEEQKELLLNYCKVRLSELSENSFFTFLPRITNGRYIGNLSWEGVQYIKYSILEAQKNILEEIFPELRPVVNKGSKLTIDQIALNLYYEGETVTIENADEIIKKYGLTSGKKLYQQASFYSKRANRLAIRETKKKQENKIKLFEFVIDLLPPDKKQQAKDELKILENQYNAEYL